MPTDQPLRYTDGLAVAPARLLLPAERALLPAASIPAELEARARAAAPDPSIFDEPGRSLVLFDLTISDNLPDSYDTRMAPSSLTNYAREALAGVPFQDSHRTDGIVRTWGRSLSGDLFTGDGRTWVTSTVYTARGIAPDLDSFLDKVRAGWVTDVSIGFHGGSFRCSLCGENYFSWDCPHIAGQSYEVRDDNGAITGREVAYAWVDGAHLAEISTVFAGSNEGAGFNKAYGLSAAGQLDARVAQALERHYRALGVRFNPPSARIVVAGEPATGARGVAAPVAGQEAPMTKEAQAQAAEPATPARDEALAAALTRAGAPDGSGPDWLADEVIRLRGVADGLRRDAEYGKAAKVRLIESALTEGVRALGDTFDKEDRRAKLTLMDPDDVEGLRAVWQEAADARFAGGRKTKEVTDLGKGDRAAEEAAPEKTAGPPAVAFTTQ